VEDVFDEQGQTLQLVIEHKYSADEEVLQQSAFRKSEVR
jgi:hypothetical protein